MKIVYALGGVDLFFIFFVFAMSKQMNLDYFLFQKLACNSYQDYLPLADLNHKHFSMDYFKMKLVRIKFPLRQQFLYDMEYKIKRYDTLFLFLYSSSNLHDVFCICICTALTPRHIHCSEL
jgi:hypothetical protein